MSPQWTLLSVILFWGDSASSFFINLQTKSSYSTLTSSLRNRHPGTTYGALINDKHLRGNTRLRSTQRKEDHFFNLLESQLAAVVQITGIDYAAVYLTSTESVVPPVQSYESAIGDDSSSSYVQNDATDSRGGSFDSSFGESSRRTYYTDKAANNEFFSDTNTNTGFQGGVEAGGGHQTRTHAQLLYQYPEPSELDQTIAADLYDDYHAEYDSFEVDGEFEHDFYSGERNSYFTTSETTDDEQAAVSEILHEDGDDEDIANLWRSYSGTDTAREYTSTTSTVDADGNTVVSEPEPSHQTTRLRPSIMKFPIDYADVRVGYISAVSKDPMFWSRVPDSHMELIETIAFAIGASIALETSRMEASFEAQNAQAIQNDIADKSSSGLFTIRTLARMLTKRLHEGDQIGQEMLDNIVTQADGICSAFNFPFVGDEHYDSVEHTWKSGSSPASAAASTATATTSIYTDTDTSSADTDIDTAAAGTTTAENGIIESSSTDEDTDTGSTVVVGTVSTTAGTMTLEDELLPVPVQSSPSSSSSSLAGTLEENQFYEAEDTWTAAISPLAVVTQSRILNTDLAANAAGYWAPLKEEIVVTFDMYGTPTATLLPDDDEDNDGDGDVNSRQQPLSLPDSKTDDSDSDYSRSSRSVVSTIPVGRISSRRGEGNSSKKKNEKVPRNDEEKSTHSDSNISSSNRNRVDRKLQQHKGDCDS